MSKKTNKKDAPNPICHRCKYWVNIPIGCTFDGECPQNPYYDENRDKSKDRR